MRAFIKFAGFSAQKQGSSQPSLAGGSLSSQFLQKHWFGNQLPHTLVHSLNGKHFTQGLFPGCCAAPAGTSAGAVRMALLPTTCEGRESETVLLPSGSALMGGGAAAAGAGLTPFPKQAPGAVSRERKVLLPGGSSKCSGEARLSPSECVSFSASSLVKLMSELWGPQLDLTEPVTLSLPLLPPEVEVRTRQLGG